MQLVPLLKRNSPCVHLLHTRFRWIEARRLRWKMDEGDAESFSERTLKPGSSLVKWLIQTLKNPWILNRYAVMSFPNVNSMPNVNQLFLFFSFLSLSLYIYVLFERFTPPGRENKTKMKYLSLQSSISLNLFLHNAYTQIFDVCVQMLRRKSSKFTNEIISSLYSQLLQLVPLQSYGVYHLEMTSGYWEADKRGEPQKPESRSRKTAYMTKQECKREGKTWRRRIV